MAEPAAPPPPATVPPPKEDGRWAAKPQAPKDPRGQQDLNKAAGVSLPNIQPLSLASRRSVDGPPGNATPGLHSERLDRDRPIERVQSGSYSARGPGSTGSRKPPDARRRIDVNPEAVSLSVEWLRILRNVTSSGELDEASLLKLQAHGFDRKTQEAARLLREVQIKLTQPKVEAKVERNADKSGVLNKQQTDAEIQFMERKIAKLREKLKRQTKELSLLQDVPREATGDQRLVDLVGAANEDLSAEANYLRNEVQRLKNELRGIKDDLSKSSPRATGAGKSAVETKLRDRALQNEAAGAQQALKQRLQESQQKLRVLNAETEASVKNAEAAKKQIGEQVRKVEAKLKETVVLRESEQIKLLAEQQTLEKHIEVQENQIKALEKTINAFSPSEFDSLREKVHQVEKELTVERQKVRAAETKIRGLQAAVASVSDVGHDKPPASQVSGEQAARAALIQLDLAPPEDKPPTPPKFVIADYGRFVKEIEDSQKELERIETKLASVKDAGADKKLELEALALKCKTESQNELKLLETKHENELWTQLSEHKHALDALNKQFQKEEEKLVDDIQKHLKVSLEEKREDWSIQQEEALAKILYFEGQGEFLTQELLRVQHQNELARRYRDFRSTFFLTLRRCEYDRQKVFHYLSMALKIPMDKLRIYEEVIIPDDTQQKHAVRAIGEPLQQGEDRFAAVLRRNKDSLEVTTIGPQSAVAGMLTLGQPGATGNPETAEGSSQPEAEGEDDPVEIVTIDRGIGGQLRISGLEEESNAELSERVPEQQMVDSATLEEDAGDAKKPTGLVRLSMEILPDAKAVQDGTAHRQQSEQVTRLSEMIGAGNSILEDLAVVGISTCKGEAVMNGKWPTESAEMIGREARYLADRYMVITSYLIRDPFVVKVIAVDNQKNEEYILYLDEADLKTLLGPKSRLLHPQFAEEMAAALIEMLHVITKEFEGDFGKKDKRRLLLTIHAVQAPPTVLNQLPIPDQLPMLTQNVAIDAKETHAADQGQLAVLPTKYQIKDETSGAAKIHPNAMITEAGELETVFEDVIILDQRFFTFVVRKDPKTSTITLQLQEAGVCQPFEIVLPGAQGVQQLRVYAQAYDFHNLTLMVTCEEVATPPSLVIRISKGDESQPVGWRDPHEQVYWLAHEDFCLISGTDATVSAMPSQKREQLVGFVNSEPPQAKSLIAARTADPPETSMTYKAQYGVDGDREGVVLHTPLAGESGRHTSEALANVLLNDSKTSSSRPLLRSERRVNAAGEKPILCSVTITEHQEPYLHFTLFAQEMEGGREWAMCVDSVEFFRALRKKLQFQGLH